MVTTVHNVLCEETQEDPSPKSFRSGHTFSEHVICSNLMDLVNDTIQFLSREDARKLRANL